MRAHERDRKDQLETTGKRPEPEAPDQGALQLAGTIGNAAMQRVADSPELQRSPGAAGLGATVARAARDEEEPVMEPGGEPATAVAEPPEVESEQPTAEAEPPEPTEEPPLEPEEYSQAQPSS